MTYNYDMKNTKKIFNICLYILLFGVILSCLLLHYFNNLLGSSLIESASLEVSRLTTIVVDNCVRKYLETGNEYLDIVEIVRNSDGDIDVIRYNTSLVNRISVDISNLVLEDINYMVLGEFDKIDINLPRITDSYYQKIDDGIVLAISIGNITGNNFLANVGPKIPLKLSLISNINVEVKNQITEYGMNNALMEVYVEIEVKPVITMPFLSEEISVKNKVPIVTEIIQGDVPDGYFSNENK